VAAQQRPAVAGVAVAADAPPGLTVRTPVEVKGAEKLPAPATHAAKHRIALLASPAIRHLSNPKILHVADVRWG
jgi:hypothetical protein